MLFIFLSSGGELSMLKRRRREKEKRKRRK